LGFLLEAAERPIQAISNYQRAIELDPHFAVAFNNWGVVLRDQGELDEAISKFKMAIELDPKLTTAYSNLGGALYDYDKRTVKDVIADFEKARSLDPKYAPIYYNWGFVLLDETNFEDAIAKFRKAE
jgi:tetratricopeptide (TPR) repeat protein